MAKVVFGCDPDSEAHGIAKYVDGKLFSLMQLNLSEIIHLALHHKECGHDVVFSIEDVQSNKFVYARNEHKSKAAQSSIAMRVGRCQQAQVEMQRMLDHHRIPYSLFPPCRSNWADNKPFFERVTGWKGQSNSDTRSAAYFGMLKVQERIKK